MSKLRVTIILIIVAAVLFGVNAYEYMHMDRTAPSINIPSSITGEEYEKGMTSADFLKGVTATDDVDGDVTDSLRVDEISENADGKSVTVSYVAKDKALNIASKSIILKKAEKKETEESEE